MRVRQLFFVASTVVAGAVLMSACGASNGQAAAPVRAGQVGHVQQVHDNDLPGTQPDVDNPDQLPDFDEADWDAVEASAPAVGYKAVVVAADDLTLTKDGTVSWVAGEVKMGDFGPEFVPSDGGLVDSAPLNQRAEFATPTGCTEPYGDVDVDANDVGLTSCEPTDYFYESSHYLPMIWLDDEGTVVKIADRYHP
jgi:hypothetical protein